MPVDARGAMKSWATADSSATASSTQRTGAREAQGNGLQTRKAVSSNLTPCSKRKVYMFKVYWTNADGKPDAEEYDEMAMALQVANGLRQDGFRFVTMVSENPNSVGKPGVDSVVDGVLPDGNIYEWKMRRTQ